MLESPFEPTAEIYRAIQVGGQKNAPGKEGLGREFYSHNWTIINDDLCEVINQMFCAGNIAATKKRCDSLPAESAKESNIRRPSPLTLLNSDYKIVARIIAQRLRPVLPDHLKETQFCGVPGNTIIDALATVRDTIAFAESRRIRLWVLSLDFKNSFGRIAHNHLFQTLQGYGIGNAFIAGMKRIMKLLRLQFK